MIGAVGLTKVKQKKQRAEANKGYQKELRRVQAAMAGRTYTPHEESKAAKARAAGVSRASLYPRKSDRGGSFGGIASNSFGGTCV